MNIEKRGEQQKLLYLRFALFHRSIYRIGVIDCFNNLQLDIHQLDLEKVKQRI